MTYKFRDVKDVLSKEDSHTHFNRPLFFLIRWQLGRRSVSQELKAGLIEVFLVFLSSIVIWEDFAECGVHLRIYVAVRLDFSLHLV